VVHPEKKNVGQWIGALIGKLLYVIFIVMLVAMALHVVQNNAVKGASEFGMGIQAVILL